VDFLTKNHKNLNNMTIFQTTFDIPNWILQGLKTGEYVRIGGVIRDSNTKQIVAMLREVSPNISGIRNLLSAASPVLGILNLGVSVINLGVSVVGFALVLNKLKKLEESCKDELNKLEERIQSNINHLHRKFDISVYANFRAALDLANDSQTMINPENRRSMAILAINRFLESQHTYSKCIEYSLQENVISLTDIYINSLALTYIARARCYLELGEINNAVTCLQEGAEILRCHIDKYVKTLLISQPIARTCPSFVNHGFVMGQPTSLDSPVELHRLARICKWLEPELNKSSDDKSVLFEAQRKNLINVVQYRAKQEVLYDALVPAAVVAAVIPIFGGLIANRIVADAVEEMINQPFQKASIDSLVLTMKVEKIEEIIETYHRFESYLLEVQLIQKQGISFKNWLELVPNTEIQEATSETIPIILLKTISENLA
jgi:tetratricopeptide (TPR) repeat protein